MKIQTPILQTLIPLVYQYGTKKAILWMEGQEELAKPDDDLCSFLARQDVEWDQLLTADQDSLRDAYLVAVQSYHVEKSADRQRLANAPQIGQDARSAADRHSIPPSPEKPVVQPSLGRPKAIRPPVGENPPRGADALPAKKTIEEATGIHPEILSSMTVDRLCEILQCHKLRSIRDTVACVVANRSEKHWKENSKLRSKWTRNPELFRAFFQHWTCAEASRLGVHIPDSVKNSFGNGS